MGLRKDRPRGDPAKGGAATRAVADASAARMAPTIAELKAAGHQSVRGLADALNANGVTTDNGGRWHPTGVHRLLKRIEGLP